jgi:dipeptidyl aminopeptidase/acylaminoacyl peptidase
MRKEHFLLRLTTLNFVAFAIVLVGLGSLLKSIPAVSAERLPTEYFTDFPKHQRVQLSPGGDFLSVEVVVGTETQVVILDTKTMKPVKNGRHRFMRDKFSVSGHSWVSDTRLVFRAERFIPTEIETPIPLIMLYAVDYDGKRENVLASPYARTDLFGASIIDPLEDDKRNALVLSFTQSGTRQKVGKMNLRTGSLSDTTSLPPYTLDIVLDQKDRPRYAIATNTDGNNLVYYRDPDSVDWELIGDYEWPGGWLKPEGFLEDETEIFVLDSRDGGTQALGVSDLRMTKVQELYRDPVTDIQNFLVGEDDFVYGYVFGIGKPQRKILDPEHPQAVLLSALEGAFPNSWVTVVDSSRDENLHLVGVYSDKNPGEYYLFDEKKNQLSYVLARRPWVKEEFGASIEAFVFESRDGMKIPALLTLPAGRDPREKLPLLVHPHGGPHGPYDVWGYDNLVQYLANGDYAVLQVNFRGSGGHGADFEAAGFRQWGRAIQHDIIDGAKYAIENFGLDGDRVGIVGASFGGYSALQSAILEPDFFKATVGIIGVYDFKLMYTNGDIRGRRSGRKYLEKALGRDEQEFLEFSPLLRADELNAPVLLIQGEKDKRTPLIHADKLAARLKELDHTFEYHIMPNEGHTLGFKPENRQANFERIRGWFDRYL